MKMHTFLWSSILNKQISLCLLSSIFISNFIAVWPCFAEEAARLYSIEGVVEGRIAPDKSWRSVSANTIFQNGDAIRTADSSRAAIVGSDGMMVRIGANSLLEFKAPTQKAGREISVASGDAYFLSRDPHNVPKVTTTIVSGSIRGTEFAVSVKPNLVTFSVLNGVVDCSNEFGAIELNPGEEGVTEPGKAPQKRLMVRPFDAVQWALRYPSLISISGYIPWLKSGSSEEQRAAVLLEEGKYFEARNSFNQNTSRSNLGKALAELALSDSASAARSLENSKTSNDPGIATLRSALALEAGQLEEAKNQQRLAFATLQSDSSPAASALIQVLKAQQATVLIVQNDRVQAEMNVKELLGANPNNIEGLYAQSLALQSRGQIEAALESVQLGIQKDPYNSNLLARAAELSFGSGETAKAEELAKHALQINPKDSDARTVLGFILISGGKVKEGQSAFEQAIAEGNSSSAHLGLGIAKFRLGQTEEGRIEIQKAVHLDPQVALYRSYLGKAFFENEKEGLAAEELATASRLDPLDPTPHLYSAFNELAMFRPVAALGSLEDAIALNDNRAVYRSRFLLDKDEATRGTGLGRIFGALDFTQPARIEALKSLAEDPTNYEAHFLLKDSLIGPETDSAAISEDVVATLLAPATFSSLLSTAAGSATLNEYTTLFERPQARNQFDVITQSKDRLIETSEAHFAGGDNYSYLLRHGMTYANGYRDNDYDRLQTGRFLGQFDVSESDKILIEGIVSGRELGDTQIGLSPESNDPDQSFQYDDFTSRLGFRHSFSEQSQLISQALFINSRTLSRDLTQDRSYILDLDPADTLGDKNLETSIFDSNSSYRTKGVRADLQHLWTTENLTLVSGASALGFKDSQFSFSEMGSGQSDLFESLEFTSDAENDVRAYRAYSYGTLKPSRDWRFIAGLNYSDLESSVRQVDPYVDGETTKSELNPKAGIIFYPSSSVTLRASYFETLGQSSSRDLEGIEPSQVAGFQQIFDDAIGTKARVAGVGADWKLPKETYLGLNLLSRNLSSPQNQALDQIQVFPDYSVEQSVIDSRFEAHSQEHTAAGYLNQILSETLTTTLNYDWTESDDDFYSYQMHTQRVRLGLNYFDPSGFFAFASETWRFQSRDNFDVQDNIDTDFGILSAGLGWQLPHRHGSVQLAVRNILDEDFNYQPIASDVRFYPGVDVSLGININF